MKNYNIMKVALREAVIRKRRTIIFSVKNPNGQGEGEGQTLASHHLGKVQSQTLHYGAMESN